MSRGLTPQTQFCFRHRVVDAPPPAVSPAPSSPGHRPPPGCAHESLLVCCFGVGSRVCVTPWSSVFSLRLISLCSMVSRSPWGRPGPLPLLTRGRGAMSPLSLGVFAGALDGSTPVPGGGRTREEPGVHPRHETGSSGRTVHGGPGRDRGRLALPPVPTARLPLPPATPLSPSGLGRWPTMRQPTDRARRLGSGLLAASFLF